MSGCGCGVHCGLRRFRGESDAGLVPVLDPITIVNFGVWIGVDTFFSHSQGAVVSVDAVVFVNVSSCVIFILFRRGRLRDDGTLRRIRWSAVVRCDGVCTTAVCVCRQLAAVCVCFLPLFLGGLLV